MGRLTVLVVVVLASLAGATAAEARTLLSVGDGTVRYQPHRLQGGGSGVACGVWWAKRLRWHSTGARRAVATGVLTYIDGETSCAEGKLLDTPATFRFYRARRGCSIYDPDTQATRRSRARIFTRVEVETSVPGLTSPWRTAPPDGFMCGVGG